VPVPALLAQPQQPLQPQALPVPQALPLPRALPLLPQAERRSPVIWLGDSQGGSRPGPPRAASASAHCTGTLRSREGPLSLPSLPRSRDPGSRGGLLRP